MQFSEGGVAEFLLLDWIHICFAVEPNSLIRRGIIDESNQAERERGREKDFLSSTY